MKFKFKCFSRNMKEKGKKTGVVEQAKNLSKLIYIKRASHEV